MTVTPDGRASVQAGAGIVADSDPASENAECAHKAAALLSAVAMARGRGPGRGHDGVAGPEGAGGAPVGDGGPGGGTRRGDGHRARRPHLPPGAVQPGPRRTGRGGEHRVARPQPAGQGRRLRAGDPDGGRVLRPRHRRRLWGGTAGPARSGSGCASPSTSSWSSGPASPLRGPTAVAPAAPGAPGGPVLALSVAWPGWSGVDLLGPAPAGDPELDGWLPEGAVRCDPEAWEAARIEAGVPVGGREVTGSTIAAEVGPRGAHRVVHQGVLHRPGAGGPPRRPGVQGGPAPVGRGRGRRCPAAGRRRGLDRRRRPRGGRAVLGGLVGRRRVPRWPSPPCSAGWCHPSRSWCGGTAPRRRPRHARCR